MGGFIEGRKANKYGGIDQFTGNKMETVTVKLKERSYNIHIKEDIVKECGKHIKALNPGKKIIIITDRNVSKLYYKTVKASLLKEGFEIHKIILKPGEHLKSFLNTVKLSNKILSITPDRNSTIVALGGGVIGDLSGFIASITLRGINFVQIPTTLLSQVDSSVGGKTGINTNYGKNLVGTFYQPKLVLIDPKTLLNLPEREFLCGYVETVKYALINNYSFFNHLDNNKSKIINKDLKFLTEIIKTAVQSKADIVSQDETEKNGTRALLNLGHTFGHALEKEVCYSDTIKHGEAVAIGIVLAAKFSYQLGFCEKTIITQIEDHFKAFNIPLTAKEIIYEWDINNLLTNMMSDKKTENAQITFILFKNIGETFLARNITTKNIIDFLESVF